MTFYTGKTGVVTLIHIRKECVVEWNMDFPSLFKHDGTFYESSEFEFEGEIWHFIIFPGGYKYMDSTGYIHLRLGRLSSNSPPMTVEITFSMKTVNGQNMFKRRSIKEMKGESYHDIPHFLSTSDFAKRESLFLVSGFLTIVCTLKRGTGNASGTTNAICSYSTTIADEENISTREKKCMERPVMCPDCFEIFLLKNWLQGHECQKKKTEECSYCKKHVDAGNISIHEEKCIDRPIKFKRQKCHDHECEAARAEVSKKFRHDFKSMLSGDLSDVTVKVKEEEFRLHKAILAARNQYFYNMFKNNMRESITGVVTVEDCDPDIFRSFIHFLYTGKVDKLSPENVCDLYNVTDKYQEDQLKKECLQLMLNTLSVENFCDYFTFALRHDEKELFQKAVEFFISKGKVIGRSVKWQTFVKDYPIQANELFLKSLDHFDK